MQPSQLTTQRLIKADKYLGMCLDSRSVQYTAIPFIIAARTLIKLALEVHENNAGH